MKKCSFKKSESVSFALYVIILVISQFFFRKSGGVLLTLPFCAVLPAVATVFYNRRLLTVLACSLLSLFFNLVSEKELMSAVSFAILAGAFAYAGIFVKRLIVTASLRSSGKRVLYLVSALLLCVAILVCYAGLFGNPISALKARAENLEYVEMQYLDGFDFKDGYTRYDFQSRKYVTTVYFSDGKEQTADISYQEGVISVDGIRDYYEEKLKESLRAEIYDAADIDEADLVVSAFSEDAIITPEISPSEVAPFAVLEVRFRKELASDEAFARECEFFSEMLEEKGIVYSEMVFHGGFAGDDLYELSLFSERSTQAAFLEEEITH